MAQLVQKVRHQARARPAGEMARAQQSSVTASYFARE
jgi:hypothetical protein